MKRYTRHQILEAIRHWKRVLESMDVHEGKIIKHRFGKRSLPRFNIPESTLKSIVKLMKSWMALQNSLGRDPTDEELASKIGVDVRAVAKLISTMRYYGLTLNNGNWCFKDKKIPNNKPAIDYFVNKVMKMRK